MSVSSVSGQAAAMQSKLRNLYQAQKPDISIVLNNKRTTYTTLDKLEGVVNITAPTDTSFDDVEIEFVGTSRTYVERLTTAAAISGRSEAFHQFLKLQQPRMQQHYPENKILEAGKTYSFPFLFVVPQQLLPRVCQHRVVSPSLRDQHLQVPPSFGDRDGALKKDALDDMVPDMASIRYGVFARVSKMKPAESGTTRTTIISKARRLRIVPASDEQPPLDVSSDDAEYTMRKERTIRKGVLKGKQGTLVMQASQPPSMRLRARSDSEQQPSMATIMLRFDPADEKASPPRLGSLTSRLKVCTYFACTARQCMPSKHASLMDLSQGLHSEQLSLSSRCVANVEWTKHDPNKLETLERRDSAYSEMSAIDGSLPEPSGSYKGNSYYIAKLLVPINLPTSKAFVPTFHSCLISRVYQLKLELGMQSVNLGGAIDLKVPLQISSGGSAGDYSPRRGSVEAGIEADLDDEDIGDFFEARTVQVPGAEFIGRSRIGSQAPVDEAPPGYSSFASQFVAAN